MVIISDLHLSLNDKVNFNGNPAKLYFTVNRLYDVANICSQKNKSLVILGDVFDNANPSGVILTIFKKYLIYLKEKNIQTIIIPGNHDCTTSNCCLTLFKDVFDNVDVILKPTVKNRILYLPHILKINRDKIAKKYNTLSNFIKSTIKEDFDFIFTHAGIHGHKYDSEVIVNNNSMMLDEGFNEYKIVSGHEHKKGRVGNIFYTGSLIPLTYREIRYNHGYTEFPEMKFTKLPLDVYRHIKVDCENIPKDFSDLKGLILKVTFVMDINKKFLYDFKTIQKEISKYATIEKINFEYTGLRIMSNRDDRKIITEKDLLQKILAERKIEQQESILNLFAYMKVKE